MKQYIILIPLLLLIGCNYIDEDKVNLKEQILIDDFLLSGDNESKLTIKEDDILIPSTGNVKQNTKNSSIEIKYNTGTVTIDEEILNKTNIEKNEEGLVLDDIENENTEEYSVLDDIEIEISDISFEEEEKTLEEEVIEGVTEEEIEELINILFDSK